MNEEEYITDYITTLATADIELSGNTPAELRFNGTTSPGELYKLLLKKEAIVTRAICQTVLAAANNKMILSMVQQHLLDMKGTITFRDGHYTHRFLRVTKNGVPLPPEQLDTPTRFRADDYLRVVQDAYLRLHGWTNGLPPVPPSPLCLNVTESEAAEMLSFLFDTGIAGCTREEWRKKDFIHYFFRAWNLPPNKDYDTLMSHVKSRPNPTTFLDKIKRMYLDHIEQKDCNRQ